MRRADRLFLIIHALRGRRTALPARDVAATLGVSLRTIYRDVADLQRSGVPIEGEAGVGYVLRKGSDIPPLMFTAEELEALVAGTRFVQAFAGQRLSRSADAALLKIQAVLPEALRERSERSRVFAPDFGQHASLKAHFDSVHAAIVAQQVLAICYADESGQVSRREVEPLALSFWGGAWTFGGWCRLRQGFRSFRLDRISDCQVPGETFADTPERGFKAYWKAIGAD
ncbi:helix-turn-helix transcriptional regulator [Tahibacter amnicola]|uniref:YafY family transcriptional regulator n=1 Tax=Tahibacter amnicola TaxID=2976241 RepID=A0ABY6BIE8_9GAMM|nr:YafY family protein [Tahibacter amnicola]UXI68396.1 YafY family transcriptional regulator [Tahibacter amnicola]